MSKRISHFPTTLLSLAFVSLTFFTNEANVATFTVTNINDTGAGSLRQAVIDSNTAAGSDTIVFDASVFSSPQTIQLTHALLPGSPAVDVADPVTFPATDQLGVARPLDGDASGGARADIGSFEKMGTTAADVTVTGRVLASNGRTISEAILQLRSAKGEPMSVRTNTFGYFQFKAVAAGESYLMTVSAPRTSLLHCFYRSTTTSMA